MATDRSRSTASLRRATACIILLNMPSVSPAELLDVTDLGRALFSDTNLSANRTQSCSTCHDPGRAFTDSRDNGTNGAVSLGDDGVSLGDRNAPTLTYARLVPDFQRNQNGEYLGGFFHDGRAATLAIQAAEPLTNPLEMAMPSQATVITRIQENPQYKDAFELHFGDDVFADDERAFDAITESLIAFQNTAMFAPFDSRYDRFLRGEYQLTEEEEFGRVLFFSQLINCSSCHLADEREFSRDETFTNNLYHNIGVPANNDVRSLSGIDAGFRDLGLLENPQVVDPGEAGKYRVPSLRNVAVTAPYMHNGVFRELDTVIRFYNQFIVSNKKTLINPETGELWRPAEVDENRAIDLLQEGQPLTDDRVAAIAAFLRTLTDRRYENLLENPD